MAKRQVYIEGVGQVTLAKRRGTTSLRLSIKPDGQIRLSLPSWTPYFAGEQFIKSRQPWIQDQLRKHPLRPLVDGDQIGKNHRLYFKQATSSSMRAKIGITTINIASNLDPSHPLVQRKAISACEKALKTQSERLLSLRLAELSRQHGLPYKTASFRKLTSRWGSCSAKKKLTISIYLVQLPWELIDYVLLHELVHTKYLNHSRQFWKFFEQILPNVKTRQKQIRAFSPRVQPI